MSEQQNLCGTIDHLRSANKTGVVHNEYHKAVVDRLETQLAALTAENQELRGVVREMGERLRFHYLTSKYEDIKTAQILSRPIVQDIMKEATMNHDKEWREMVDERDAFIIKLRAAESRLAEAEELLDEIRDLLQVTSMPDTIKERRKQAKSVLVQNRLRKILG